MMATTTRFRSGERIPFRFTVTLRRQAGGAVLKRIDVGDAELGDAQSELWRDGCLRKGLVDAPLNEMSFELEPVWISSAADGRCSGFALKAINPLGAEIRREFPIEAFKHLATAASEELVHSGILQLDDSYVYELAARAAVGMGESPYAEITKPPAPIIVRRRLEPLLEAARVIGDEDSDAFPVFYTEAALEKAERFARKGADRVQPVETGAVLVGVIGSCPETGEMFVVVVDAIEVLEAEETKVSLAYTGRSWAGIQAIIRVRRAQPGWEALRMCGQAHGHNFIVGGDAPPCEACELAKVCGRSSVFVSSEDRLWSQAVFAHQPWSFCHIFGLDARNRRLQGLFTLRRNQLLPRAFHVIPEFSTTSK